MTLELARKVLRRLRRLAFKPTYADRFNQELKIYAGCENVHDLPEIFHYWSNKYLLPVNQQFGFNSPDDFFASHALQAQQARPDAPFTLVSVGSGNGELEVAIAEKLHVNGARHFTIECVDINPKMLERTLKLARQKGLEQHLAITRADFNHWQPEPATADMVIANQSLHHVLNLEGLFAAIKSTLKDNGSFLTSDMIGRNGHQRWPEALEMVQAFWSELPEPYKYNQLMRRKERKYINHDCSDRSFEGIRAQDILPLLVENFHFELFIPFANIVTVFIDRAFGHNFDASATWDRDFIDRVHAADEEAILAGTIKPTQMLAVMKKHPVEKMRLRHPRLTPEYCIRTPDH